MSGEGGLTHPRLNIGHSNTNLTGKTSPSDFESLQKVLRYCRTDVNVQLLECLGIFQGDKLCLMGNNLT